VEIIEHSLQIDEFLAYFLTTGIAQMSVLI
jgi:hypothetical protein